MSTPPSDKHDFPGAVLLRTRRLQLRELCFGDIADLRRLNAHEDVSRWLLEPCPADFAGVARSVLEANAVYRHRPGLGVWRADTNEGAFIGLFSLMPVDDGGEVEIGARLFPHVQGRFYSVEGSVALCGHAFAATSLPRLVGFCHPQNRAVPAILRRLGFTQDGTTEHFGRPALRFVLDRGAWNRRGALRNEPEDRQAS